jgi:hypothetical protein
VAVSPAQLLQTLCERCHAGLQVRIIRGSAGCEHADAPYALPLLRPRAERPRGSRAANKGNELAPSHEVPSDEA